MRRNLQFLFGRLDGEFEGLQPVAVRDGYVLHINPNLRYSIASDAARTLIVIGTILNPDAPEKDIHAIAEDVIASGLRFDEVLPATESLGGKYAFIYLDESDISVSSDAQANQQVYILHNNEHHLVGSDPRLFESIAGVRCSDPEKERFYQTEYFQSWKGKFWPGVENYFDGVTHLLPNHYYSFAQKRYVRFWPLERLEHMEKKQGLERAVQIYEGSMDAVSRHAACAIPVTCGLDTRMLVAASRKFRDRFKYFVINFRELGPQHPDIFIPKQMLADMGMAFHIQDAHYDIDPAFRERYNSDVFGARALDLPSSYTLHKHFSEYTVIHGVLMRTPYRVPDYITLEPELLAYFRKQPLDPYILGAYRTWLETNTAVCERTGIHPLDLSYWELTLGGWGGLSTAQSDTAGVNLTIFSNLELYRIWLSMDEQLRMPPDYEIYNSIIEAFWPELLNYPVNPPKAGLKRQAAAFARTAMKRLHVYDHFRAYNIKQYYKKNVHR